VKEINANREISNKECPFESIPVHAGTGMSTFLATKPTTSDTVIVLVALRGHTSFATLKCLPTATSLGQHVMVSIGLSGFASARSGGQQARGELGRKVVDGKRDILRKVGALIAGRARRGVVVDEGRGRGLEGKLSVRDHGSSGRSEGVGRRVV